MTDGALVVALPLLRSGDGIDLIGLSMFAPGGYAEQMVVQESLMLPVPNGLAPEVAALTEPLAVAWHAVRRGDVRRRTVAVVIGCGPIGLGVILMLKAKGVRTVVASDVSAARRELAARCGADVVVDPGVQQPFAASNQGHLRMPRPRAGPGRGNNREAGAATRRLVARPPPGGGARAAPRRPVIFECVGVPGVIESIIDGALLFSRVVVAGVCVGPDRFTPALAINKELRPAVRVRLFTSGVPRHPAYARRRQGPTGSHDHGNRGPPGSAEPVRGARHARPARQDPHRSGQRHGCARSGPSLNGPSLVGSMANQAHRRSGDPVNPPSGAGRPGA